MILGVGLLVMMLVNLREEPYADTLIRNAAQSVRVSPVTHVKELKLQG